MSEFKVGQKVKFIPGRGGAEVTAKITKAAVTTGEGRARKTFVETTDADGKVRKVMPGALRAA